MLVGQIYGTSYRKIGGGRERGRERERKRERGRERERDREIEVKRSRGPAVQMGRERKRERKRERERESRVHAVDLRRGSQGGRSQPSERGRVSDWPGPWVALVALVHPVPQIRIQYVSFSPP